MGTHKAPLGLALGPAFGPALRSRDLRVEGRLNLEGSSGSTTKGGMSGEDSVSKKAFGIDNRREEPEESTKELAGNLNLTPLRGNQWEIN